MNILRTPPFEPRIVKSTACFSGRNRDLGASINPGRVKNGRRYRLIARSPQGEAVFPRMGTCIGRCEGVITGKEGRGIGTGEVDVAIDNGVPPPLDRHGHDHGKWGTRGCSGGSSEVKYRVRRGAAECHRYRDCRGQRAKSDRRRLFPSRGPVRFSQKSHIKAEAMTTGAGM